MKNKLHKIIFLSAILAGTITPLEQATPILENSSEVNLSHSTKTGRRKFANFSQPTLKVPYNALEQETENYKTNNFYNDTDEVLLARMLLGECENCSEIEKISVAYTAINRVNDEKKWNGETLQEVILMPLQYSAFNENLNSKLKDPMRYNPQEFESCLQLAREILAGKHSDPTNGATHYLNPNHPMFRRKPLPQWTNTLQRMGKIQNSIHLFYKEN